jgi:hypothetical protein
MSQKLSNSERNEMIELLLRAAELQASSGGADNALEAARDILARAEAAKAEREIEREMSPYDKGYRDCMEGLGSDPERYNYFGSEETADYGEGFNEGSLMLEDGRTDQIESDFLDGECTLSGNYFSR